MSARLVLGLGGTVDYEIRWDAAVISDLARHHGVRRAELAAPGPIDDERALIVAILALLERGVGGERFAASSDLLETFAARFETAVTLGGTGVRAGIALANLGIPSTQHLVSIDDNVRRLMPPIVDWVCSASADTLDPHLIVQYPAGAVVALADGEIVAPSANRVIIANDRPNREMAIAPPARRAPARRRCLPRVGIQHDAGCRASGPAPRRAGGRDESASGRGVGLLRGCRVLSP